jgi:succinate dehydrogenase / fumarate reductase cytochrome b subunit
MRVSQLFSSTIGKKLVMGITGLSWVGFVIGHLIGNTTLLLSDPAPFNKYAHFLTNLGGLLYLIEAVLAASLLFHIVYAVLITLGKWKARPVKYKVFKRADDPSKRGIATASMIYTGILLVVFLVIHINNFKYGTVYMTTVGGVEMRDLYRTVYEYFANPFNVAYYVIMMILLGTHLSHGVWSAFQSLGINGNRFTPIMYKLGFVLSIFVGIGFIGIPMAVYLIGGAS